MTCIFKYGNDSLFPCDILFLQISTLATFIFRKFGDKTFLKPLNIFIFFRNKSGYFGNTFGKALTWNKQIDTRKNKFIEERRRTMKRQETTSTIFS